MKLNHSFYPFLLLALVFTACTPKVGKLVFKTAALEVEGISKNTWLHRSFLETKAYGKVACNGLVYIHRGEALIMDTPANLEATQDLINWVEEEKKAKIVAVVAGHFHEDCLVGLPLFHQQKIPSYGQEQTVSLAPTLGFTPPENTFSKEKNLQIGGRTVHLFYPGAGHTQDNIVAYIPTEKALFGGCLLKSLGAGKGNLADANIEKWSSTVKNVQDHFPNIKHVVPGHGKAGDASLLEFTRNLFTKK